MSEELRPCPFCGAMPMGEDDRYMCSTLGCVMQEDTISAKDWNTRPIEDDLRKRIAELERDFDMLFRAVIAASKQSRKNTQTQTIVYGKEGEE